MNNVSVIGLGYIGLPTAALLANSGFHVNGMDVQKHVVETINQGRVHIVEPDLQSFVSAAVKSGNFVASTEVKEADVFIIAVPTPFGEGYEPDLSYVFSAAKSIATKIQPGNLVILESTSPVGTTEKMAEVLKAAGVNIESIHIAHCPERVLPGQIMRELVENDRVIGGFFPTSTVEVAKFYEKFVKGDLYKTDARTAEMTKLAENSFRDVNIAYANELSMICDELNISTHELISLANRHPRVNILKPGPGVGGHCIAVDPWFIVASAPEKAKLIRQAREVNTYKTKWVIEKIKNTIHEFSSQEKRAPNVCLMGLSFKPNVDDLRESPAVGIAKEVINFHKATSVVEPHIKNEGEFPLMTKEEAAQKADIVVFLVAHKTFADCEFNEGVKVLDFCGIMTES